MTTTTPANLPPWGRATELHHGMGVRRVASLRVGTAAVGSVWPSIPVTVTVTVTVMVMVTVTVTVTVTGYLFQQRILWVSV